ncbi:MAG: hypothetical protein A2Y33_05430 [Spirochaetes bacterium GWF1_51_8]|nr:MAG: hypothetical protein A2Y33_05430 [Spirochaetes bacterium GWF1_51_8]
MRFAVAALILFCIASSGAAELKLIKVNPLKLGEKLIFTVSALGAYLGDQIISIDKTVDYQGQKAVQGGGSIKSSEFVAAVYSLNDREITYFLPGNMSPLYNEKWIKEGDWIDRMYFYFLPGKVEYKHDKGGGAIKTLPYEGDVIRNFYTLIQVVRLVDYDYYIQNKLNIEILYLFGETVTKTVFKPQYKTINFKGKQKGVIYLEEVGGMNFQVTLLNSPERIPLILKVPSYSANSQSINFDVELKSYVPGLKPMVE